MTIQDALKSVTNYPIPQRTLETFAGRRGLDLNAIADQNALNSSEFRKGEADVKSWLASAPNFSEGGVSFNFSQSERDAFRREAAAIYCEVGSTKPRYGYVGEDL